MKMQKHRSLASTMRFSLLAGAGALGWMAVGASGATAAEVPADSGLLGSLTGTVESAAAPATSAVSALTDPLQNASARAYPAFTGSEPLLQNVPVLPDVVALVPQLTSQPAGTVLTPVTRLVDGVATEVPIVQSVIPAGTLTGVTAPVVATVDGVVGGIAEPVLDVVAPVVEVITPVVDVVVPVQEIALPAPVAPVPAPIANIVPGVEHSPSVPPSATPASDAAGAGVDVLPDTDALPDTPGAETSSAPAAATRSGAVISVDGAAVLRAFQPEAPLSAVIRAAIVDAVMLPGLGGAAQAVQELPGLPIIPLPTSGGVPSSMTGAGSAAPLVALSGAAFLIFPTLTGVGRSSAAAVPPSGPSFDPGSSPD